MTLDLFEQERLETPPLDRAKALSQWFTPRDLAQRIAYTSVCPRYDEAWRILEPSAGDGALVHAARDASSRATVDAYDIDPALCERHGWTHADYLTNPAPERLYDLALMNPPYEGGLDAAFVGKAMDESTRVVALVRSAFMHGAARHRSIWSRVESGEWSLVGVSYLVGRPSFLLAGGESGSPLSDFIVIQLRRGGPVTTSVDWWRLT